MNIYTFNMHSHTHTHIHPAIRGGIPLVFPQFGQPKKEMSQHGFARNSNWELAEELATDEVVKAVFHLSDSDSTRALWPYPFLLSYTLSLTAKALTTSLRIENKGEQPFEAQALLHTYLRVKDIGRVGVHGYHGKSFLDKVAPPPHGPTVEERKVATIGQVMCVCVYMHRWMDGCREIPKVTSTYLHTHIF